MKLITNEEQIERIKIQAKKEVFDEIQVYLDNVNDKIPWGMIMAHGHSFEEPSPSWDELKKKHLGSANIEEAKKDGS